MPNHSIAFNLIDSIECLEVSGSQSGSQAQYVWGIQEVIGAKRNIARPTIDAIRDDRSDGIPPDDLQIIGLTRQTAAQEPH